MVSFLRGRAATVVGVVMALGAITNPMLAQTNDEKKAEPGTPDTSILGKSRTFLFTYAGTVKSLKPGQEASVWLPVAGNTLEQEAEIVAKKLPANGTFRTEKQYGNTALFFKAAANEKGEVPFEII